MYDSWHNSSGIKNIYVYILFLFFRNKLPGVKPEKGRVFVALSSVNKVLEWKNNNNLHHYPGSKTQQCRGLPGSARFGSVRFCSALLRPLLANNNVRVRAFRLELRGEIIMAG